MNVLSLFDGISVGQVALGRANIKVDNYFASEIKKHAIKVTQEHFPNTYQLGDILELNYKKLPIIDLLIGGSPCQDISNLKPKGTIYDSKSVLFFKYFEILQYLRRKNPNLKFLLENVNGDKKSIEIISNLLQVQPIRINSNLVSFQNRDRLYWTNIKDVTIPENRYINFQDFKEPESEYTEKYKVNKTPSRDIMWGNGLNGKCPNVTNRDKINCLTLKQDRWSNSGLVKYKDYCRYLTTRELELAQTLPIGYTSSLSIRQSEDVLGDCWTAEVITHIFKNLKR